MSGITCDGCGFDSDDGSVQWIDNQTARCSRCCEFASRIEREAESATIARIVAWLRAQDGGARQYLSVTLAADAIERGEWRGAR